MAEAVAGAGGGTAEAEAEDDRTEAEAEDDEAEAVAGACGKASTKGARLPCGLCQRPELWSSKMQKTTRRIWSEWADNTSRNSSATTCGGLPKAPHPKAERTKVLHSARIPAATMSWIFVRMVSLTRRSW